MTRRQRIDPEIAEMIAADLPDGAYWAMMEELTGMEPAELVSYEPHRKSPRHQFRTEAHTSFTVQCPDCGRRFRKETHMVQHARDVHQKEAKP